MNLPSITIKLHETEYVVYPRLEPIKNCIAVSSKISELLCYVLQGGQYVCVVEFFKNLDVHQTYFIYKKCLSVVSDVSNKQISLNVDMRFLNSLYIEKLLLEITSVDLIFEYSENNVFQCLPSVRKRLNSIRENSRASIWLDDFGTKMANFDLVTRLEFDGIKVSKELFWDLFFSDITLLKRLIGLMKMKANLVVIEGVDSFEKYIFCKEHNCLMQGYFFNDYEHEELSQVASR